MSDKKLKYRHELKYTITYFDYLTISQRLKAVMKPDTHTNDDGRYEINSIYFDNYKDKALLEKVYGIEKREKFRIRYYNDDFSHLKLEKKIKNGSLCLKCSASITNEECQNIIDGNYFFMANHPSDLVKELYCKMKFQLLRPRVLVSYIREPYIYKAGNVRITFDMNIKSSLYHRDFLTKNITGISVQDRPYHDNSNYQMIMEVKYDEYLPEIISHIIQSENIRQESFSKYGACRRFG